LTGNNGLIGVTESYVMPGFGLRAGLQLLYPQCPPTAGTEGQSELQREPGLRALGNPGYGMTTLEFRLEESQRVTLTIHDVTGRLVRTLADRRMPAAAHTVLWDGKNDTGAACVAGTYFSRLKSRDQLRSRSIVLTR
jgi:hypothetical protein